MHPALFLFVLFFIKIVLSDYIGATETTVYQIGCTLPQPDPENYVADPGFEGGASSHAMPSPAGIPGYNLDDHQAYWSIPAYDPDGVANGRAFDDATWLRYDTGAPRSGRQSGRIFLPSGGPLTLPLPCERGNEHYMHQAKSDPVCAGGVIRVLNHTSYAVSLWARGSRSGMKAQIVLQLPPSSPGAPMQPTAKVGAPAVLGTNWSKVSAKIPARMMNRQGWVIAVAVEGWAPRERAAVLWLDDAVVYANHTAT